MRVRHHVLTITTGPGIRAHDLTPAIRKLLDECGRWTGYLTVTSRHTTTAITVNENEPRLLEDLVHFLERLAPAGDHYLHNDIHLRECPPDEPRNAHAHLLAMLLGSSAVVPIVDGALDLGTWQSVFLVELDGPRERTVGLQVCGE
jgi:secondary thiamine-phosphate synthase enzyme